MVPDYRIPLSGFPTWWICYHRRRRRAGCAARWIAAMHSGESGSGIEVHPVQGASADELAPGDQFGLDTDEDSLR
ncbi:hypothetical protein GCM10010309_02590 [Streptomyces violaceochromogenes]|nr:hypothetical protein GCM10010309_02590 [Streptomyces violaceochromogenes]